MREVVLPEPLGSILSRIEPKALTNFYGEPGVGKTNICLLAALSCIENGGNVTYIDTEGGFSVERLKQLCPTKWMSALKRIKLLEPKNFREQAAAIKSISGMETGLVILDSAVALYRLEYCGQNGHNQKNEIMKANRELSRQVSVLSNLSREKGIPVIITAHMFRNWETEKTGKMSERKATVIKHRSIPEGGNVRFMITNNGIKPSGFRIF